MKLNHEDDDEEERSMTLTCDWVCFVGWERKGVCWPSRCGVELLIVKSWFQFPDW